MMHLLPRETGDALGWMDAMGNNTETDDKTKQTLTYNLTTGIEQLREHASVAKFINKSPITPVPEAPKEEATEDQKKQISQLYESNPEFKEALLNHPEEVKAMATKDPKWGTLFRGIDIDALSAQLQKVEENK
jgi:hypothetical protein